MFVPIKSAQRRIHLYAVINNVNAQKFIKTASNLDSKHFIKNFKTINNLNLNKSKTKLWTLLIV